MSLAFSTSPTAAPIGALIAAQLDRTADRCHRTSGAQHRTGAPVRRGSKEEGTFEDAFFVPITEAEQRQMIATAKATVREGRRLARTARQDGRKLTKAERTIAGLKSSAVEIFDVLLRLARRFAGKVFPTYDHIMGETDLSRATVGRALKALEAVGLVIRQQRFRRVKGEGKATQYRQTSNAYRTSLPARLVKLLPRWRRPAPVPDDHIQREADRLEDQQHMLDGLTCRELARQTLPPGPLAAAVAAFGDRLDAQIASNNLVLNCR